ncbi:MAG: aldo/keto reductase [Solirubrobacteraceae bacterium]
MPRAGVEDNLRSLQVERMDLVNLRLMNTDASGDLLAQQLGTLEDLHGEGKLDLIGISEAGADAVGRALDLVDIAEVQNSYSVVNRSGEDVLELCMAREIAFVPYFPLGSAFSGGPSQLAQDPVISGVAHRRGITVTQVALAWLLARYVRMLLIPGTSSVGTSRRTWPRRTSSSTHTISPSSRKPPRWAIRSPLPTTDPCA